MSSPHPQDNSAIQVTFPPNFGILTGYLPVHCCTHILTRFFHEFSPSTCLSESALLSGCPPVCLCIYHCLACLSVHLFSCLSVHLSVCVSVTVLVVMCVCLSISASVLFPICVCASVYHVKMTDWRSVCSTVSLSKHLYTSHTCTLHIFRSDTYFPNLF